MALDHNWLPWQVDALDPDFVDDLQLAKLARNDERLLNMKSDDPAVKEAQKIRKAALAKWRTEASRGV